MPINQAATLLTFANLQMASEATRIAEVLAGTLSLSDALLVGNGRSSKFTPTQASQFVQEWNVLDHRSNTSTGFSGTLFECLVDDPLRGLMRGQTVICFRSTEFVDDAIRDSVTTNSQQIWDGGWAIGQIADMKAWFDSLKADPEKLKDKDFSVTGYSLGGHLATALNLLYPSPASRIAATYSFNGAGVGDVKPNKSLLAIVNEFESRRADAGAVFAGTLAQGAYAQLRSQYAGGIVKTSDTDVATIDAQLDDIVHNAPGGLFPVIDAASRDLLITALSRIRELMAEARRIVGFQSGSVESPEPLRSVTTNIEAVNIDYQIAVLMSQRDTQGLAPGTALAAYTVRNPGPFNIDNMFDIYGDTSPSIVANSQLHYGQTTPIFIEDQPLYRGSVVWDSVTQTIAYGKGKLLHNGFAVNDFGDTHSLVLLVDSLSIQNALAMLDPNVDSTTLTKLLQAASSAKKSEQPGGQGKAEGDVLERTLDAMRRMLMDPAASATTANMDGGTWANAAARENFHQQLKSLVESPAFVALKGKVNVALSVAAELKASAKSDFAAFVALQVLSPITLKPLAGQTAVVESALSGGAMATVYAAWSADKGLTTAERTAGKATFSDRFYNDRGDLLGAVVSRNLNNAQGLLSAAQFGGSVQEQTVYSDAATQTQLVVGGTSIPSDPSIRKQVWFGGDLSEARAGSDRGDKLYGGGNDDALQGLAGADWLEGNTGADSLIGGAGNDTLQGGAGSDTLQGEAENDLLLGGEGGDVYKFAGNWGADTVIDSDGQGSIEVAGLGLITGAGVKRVSPNSWQTPDRQVNYTLVTVDAGRTDLIITFADLPNVITIRNWSESKNLGIINLNGAVEATPTSGLRELVQLNGIEGFGFLTDPVAYHIIGGTGENKISTREFDDIVEGGLGEDEIHGNAGNDFLYADFAVNLQAAIDGAMIDQSLVQFSLLEGDSGDDVMIGANSNYLYGGGGRDIMVGGGAADIIQGDTFDGAHSTLGNQFEAVFEHDQSLGKMTYYVTRTSNGTTQYFTRSGAEAADGNDDTIYGGAGVDVVFGEMGDDLIDLGSGDDFGVGSDADDTVMGGSGDDEIFGDFNHDDRTPTGTEPDRLLAGWVGLPGVFHGDDVLAGDAGNDSIWGNGGSDSLYGGDGVDFLLGDDSITPDQFHGGDWIDGGAGNDEVIGGGADDALFGGVGNDKLWGDDRVASVSVEFHGFDWLDGEDGDDSLVGGGSADTLYGGEGNDSLLGDDALSLLSAAAHGDDVLDGEGGNDTLFGLGGDDELFGGTGNDLLVGDGDDGDDLTGDDWLDGGDGDDTLRGGAGIDWLIGDAGADLLQAGAGDDTLEGGLGTDHLEGGAGNDTYLLDAGDSPLNALGLSEAIYDTQGLNTVEFGRGVDLQAMSAGMDGQGTLIIFMGGGDVIGIQGGVGGAVQTYRFANGQSLSYSELIGRLSTSPMSLPSPAGTQQVFGGRGNDAIASTGGLGLLSGGLGDDTLTAAGGGNAYLYSLGDGRDTVTDVGGTNPNTGAPLPTSRIVFGAGITPTDVTLATDGALILNIGQSGFDQIRINGFSTTDALTAPNIDAYVFADGTTLTHGQLLGRGFDFSGTDTAEDVTGTSVADRFAASAGSDSLRGGTGGDTYAWGLGAGVDTVIDGDSSPSGAVDALRIAAGLAPAEVVLYHVGDDLLVRDRAATGSVTVVNHFAGSGIESMAFQDGTVWDAVAIAAHVTNELTDGADNYTGSAADDIVDAKGGNDTVRGGAGNDSVAGSAGNDSLLGEQGNDTLNGGAGTDTLWGGDGDDTLTDGEALYGEAGSDTYVLTAWQAATILDAGDTGAGVDTLVLPVPAADVRVLRGYNASTQGWDDLVLRANGQTGDVLIDRFVYAVPADGTYKVETIRFSDATVWTVADVFARDTAVQTTEGNDFNIIGYRFADTLDGKAGNDIIDGRQGNDTVAGGTGNDSVFGGEGADVVLGGDGADAVYGDGSAFVEAGNGSDTLDGGPGADTLYGAGGNDAYRFGRASGVDRVEEASGTDRIVLESGITPADVTLLRNGADLVLAIDAGATQMTIAGHFSATTSQIEAVEFADATVWSASEIAARTIAGTPNAMTGTAGNDTFVVDNTGDTVTEAAGQGIDTVQASVSYTLGANLENLVLTGYLNAFGNGNAEANQVTGNVGHNALTGGSGQDTLVGSGGNDSLRGNDVTAANDGSVDSLAGGAGDDTYYVHSNDGDFVVEQAGEGADTVDLHLATYQYFLPAQVENLVVSVDQWSGAVTLTGNALNNSIAANPNRSGRTLDGGIGADTLIGPSFDLDATFVVDNPGDVIVGGGSGAPVNGKIGGVDTVVSTIDWTLAFNHEALQLLGAATYGTGNALNNVLDGSGTAVANVLTGGLGDDTYRIGAGDAVVEQAGQGTDAVVIASGTVGSYSIAPFANVENLTLADAMGASGAEGNDADNVIFGNVSSNVLSGLGGNDQIADAVGTTDVGHDTLLGGAGNDTLASYYGQDVMDGGAGDDVLRFARLQATGTVVFGKGMGHDVAEGGWATAVKRVQFKADTLPGEVLFTRSGPDLVATVAGTGDTLTLKYFFVDDVSWTPTGEFGTFEFTSEGVQFSAAAIASRAQSGNVNLATPGDDLLLGGSGNDTLAGAAGSDNLLSGDGDDELTGGLGGDALYGGLGNDTYRFASGDGFDTIRDTGGANDRVRFTDMPSAAISVRQFGSDLWFLQQSTGSGLMAVRDFFTGAAFEIEAAEFSDAVVWDNATLKTMASQITGTGGADSLTGSSAADRIFGLAGNDTLTGLDGDDLLDGGTGNDSMVGGLGNDAFVVDSTSDTVVEASGQGIDTVQSSVTYTLPSTQNVENLTLTGSANINATGNTLANVLTGNAGNNTLTGGTGADTMIGGAGNDTYVVDNVGDVVTELAGEGTDLVQSGISITALAANVENLTLTGTATTGTGNALDNVITGNASANTLNGGAGNDRIDGGSGTDTMAGGTGNDTYVVNTSADVVTELAGEGTDTIESTVTLSLATRNNIENVRLLGTSGLGATGNAIDNVLIGNGGANSLNGGDGDDRLDGGSGNDTMTGGLGNDTYVINVSTDVITETAGQGTDTVESTITFTLSNAALENLTLIGTSLISGTGNGNANVLTGNGAANTLAGAAGNDTYDGGAGNDALNDTATTSSNDTYSWGTGYGVDTITDAGGTDTVQFGAGITAGQLVFSHVGNHLEVTISGNAADKLVVTNYYVGTANKIETFRLNDGSTVGSGQIPLSVVNREQAAVTTGADLMPQRERIMPVARNQDGATELAASAALLRAANTLPWKLWALRDDMRPEPEVPIEAPRITDAIMLGQAHSLVSAMAAFGAGDQAVLDSGRQTTLPVHRVDPMWASPALM